MLIARTLAQQADHLLLDEPTNHLDIRYQHEILQLVRSLDVTTVVVLHDLNLAARYCDRSEVTRYTYRPSRSRMTALTSSTGTLGDTRVVVVRQVGWPVS